MAYTAPTVRTTGELVTASIWNVDLVANIIELRAGGWALSGQVASRIPYSSSGTQFVVTNSLTFDGNTFVCTAGVVGAQTLMLENSSSGAANYSDLIVRGGTNSGVLRALTQGFSTSGFNIASSTVLNGQGAGGVSIVADNAAGPIRFYSGGSTETARFHASRGMSIGNTTDPGATNLLVVGQVQVGTAIGGTSGLEITKGSATLKTMVDLYNSTNTNNCGVAIDLRVQTNAGGFVGARVCAVTPDVTAADCALDLYSATGSTASRAMRIHGSRGVSIGNTTDLGAANLSVNGYIQTVGQPGFLAYNSANDTAQANGAVVDFDTEVYDELGNFAADTFTAPVTGRYQLNWVVTLASASTTIVANVNLVTSNRSYASGRVTLTAAGAETDASAAGSVVADMDAGDTAQVQLALNTGTVTIAGTASPYFTYFSGRLLP